MWRKLSTACPAFCAQSWWPSQGVTENPLAESYAKPSSSVVSSVVSSSALRAAQLSHSNSDSAPAEAAPQTHEAQQVELRAREAALKAALQRKVRLPVAW